MKENIPDLFWSEQIIAWQKQAGRHHLPWQNTKDVYRIWLSEIMLQQTQVETVIPYYQRFLERFPDVKTLAEAPLDEVMNHWSGLGYYSRARHLHECAKQVQQNYAGVFPKQPEQLISLPGIGKSTAAAIAAFGYGVRAAILDGNVKRILLRYFAIFEYPARNEQIEQLWTLAEQLLPQEIEIYTQGLMDLGATLCKRHKPRCSECPLQEGCLAYQRGLTKCIPASKPKKAYPRKQLQMLIILNQEANQQTIYLKKRPETGIWGGLFSLPEFSHSDNSFKFRAYLRDIGKLEKLERLNSFTHNFTHFQLAVTPWLAVIRKDQAFAQESQDQWISFDQIEQVALPAPIKKLLTQLSTKF